MESVALNIGANSNTPGGRGPIYPDGSFRYVPITEGNDAVSEPSYDDLDLGSIRPDDERDTITHFDPEFPELSYGENYTYGDRHAIKTNQIADLEEGNILFFYATLDYVGGESPDQDWINEDWGAYIIGHFTLEYDPIHKDDYESIPEEIKKQLSTNAHFRRDKFDAEYLVLGNSDQSELYDTPVPLSGKSGTDPNQFVTKHSHSSSEGPWYRRPLEFDTEATRAILQAQQDYHDSSSDEPEVKSQTKFEPSELGEKGQLKWFIHSPQSEYPVRDILNKGKTETYIEQEAENYCNKCYQSNVRTFAETDSRRYLFLFTKCDNEELYEHGERRIVGYIDKKRKLDMGGRIAVQGDVKLVDFKDSVDLVGIVDSPTYVRNEVLDEETANRLVDYFDKQENILEDCLEEVEQLKRKRKEMNHHADELPTSSGSC